MRYSTLTLERRIREGGRGKTRRDFLDFVLDGRSLRDLFEETERVGVLGSWSADHEREAVRHLTLRADSQLPSGRVPLYLCPECGDFDCGTLAARVEETDDAFIWSDFVSEVTYTVEPDDDGIQQHYREIGPYRIRKEDYLRTFSAYTDYMAV